MTLVREIGATLGARSAAAILLAATGACATVKIVAPDEPIEINLNIKIEQELRLKLDKEAADLIADNPDIF
ncbi:MAG: YnbE family lipoprotein [Parvularculaceae bacterium]